MTENSEFKISYFSHLNRSVKWVCLFSILYFYYFLFLNHLITPAQCPPNTISILASPQSSVIVVLLCICVFKVTRSNKSHPLFLLFCFPHWTYFWGSSILQHIWVFQSLKLNHTILHTDTIFAMSIHLHRWSLSTAPFGYHERCFWGYLWDSILGISAFKYFVHISRTIISIL